VPRWPKSAKSFGHAVRHAFPHDPSGESVDCGRNKTWDKEETFWASVKDNNFDVDSQKQDALAGRWARQVKKDCWSENRPTHKSIAQ
jgi:hypothetical protein